METINDLDSLVIKEGEELDRSTKQILNVGNGKLAYDDANMPLPGQAAELPTSDAVELDKDQAEYNLMSTAARIKMQKEAEEFNKMSDSEKVKDYVLKANYYKYTNDFYHKNGFEMTGAQKRNLKRDLEKLWKKGKFKVTPEQREDILYELSKPTNAAQQTEKQENLENNTASYISDLNSVIFK